MLRCGMEKFRRFLRRNVEKYGRIALWIYALLFLTLMALLLGLVYFAFGVLAWQNPKAVLWLTGALVVVIVYTTQFK